MASPRKVLFITYDFPPGLSGVRRVVKFAKFLPEFGFEPLVIAAKPDERMPLDYDALREVERQRYRVLRTTSADPYQLLRLLPWKKSGDGSAARSGGGKSVARSIADAVFVPDDRVGWVPFAYAAADRLLRREKIEYVVTSSFPHSAHLVGLLLRRKHRVKWVADFRDGWTQNPYFRAPTSAHAAANRKLERVVVRRADAVVAVTQPIRDHLAGVREGEAHLITNGFDPADFEGLERMPFDRFTLAYTGTLFMQRSPRVFFEALRALLDEHPGLAENFQVVFMTKFQPEHARLIDELNLQPVVRNLGLGTYREALRLQVSADALLVLEARARNSEIMMTQKIFEYLAARKPILAVTPPGVLAATVRRSGAGVVADPDDVVQIKERLFELFHGQVKIEPDEDFIAQFHRRELTRRLAEVMEEL